MNGFAPHEEEFQWKCQGAFPSKGSMLRAANRQIIGDVHDSYSRGSTRHFEKDFASQMNPVSLHFLNRWRK